MCTTAGCAFNTRDRLEAPKGFLTPAAYRAGRVPTFGGAHKALQASVGVSAAAKTLSPRDLLILGPAMAWHRCALKTGHAEASGRASIFVTQGGKGASLAQACATSGGGGRTNSTRLPCTGWSNDSFQA